MVSPKLSWKKKNVPGTGTCIVCKLFLTVWETWVTNIPGTLPSDLGLFYPVIYVHYSLVEFKLLRCKNITKHDILNECIHYLPVKLFVVHPVMVNKYIYIYLSLRVFWQTLSTWDFSNTVNPLLFAMTLFHSLQEINWFMAAYFLDQDVHYLEKKN